MEALLITPTGMRIVQVPNPPPPVWNERIVQVLSAKPYAKGNDLTTKAMHYPYRTFSIVSNRTDEIAVYESLQ